LKYRGWFHLDSLHGEPDGLNVADGRTDRFFQRASLAAEVNREVE
jgi:hypothetical protein